MVQMHYQHTALRDGDRLGNHYGVGGFCRTGTYGMPQFDTNTMRLCTREPYRDKDDGLLRYDATVPVQPVNGGGFAGDEGGQCSDSADAVPWTFAEVEKGDRSQRSLGGCPMCGFAGRLGSNSATNWNLGTGSSQKYPSQTTRLTNTYAGVAESGWHTCADGHLLQCTTDAECVPLYSTTAPLQCKRGVCVKKLKTTDTCYAHEDCMLDTDDRMCSGDGYCVSGVVQVLSKSFS